MKALDFTIQLESTPKHKVRLAKVPAESRRANSNNGGNTECGYSRNNQEKAGDDSLQAYLISLAKKDVTTVQYTLEKTNGRRGDKESVRTDEIHS